MPSNRHTTFWSPTFWLPPSRTWDEIQPAADNKYPDYRHILFSWCIAFCLMVIRYTLLKGCFIYFGKLLGIKYKKRKIARPNETLEKFYQSGETNSTEVILKLAAELNWPKQKIIKWIIIRQLQDKPSTLRKFCESNWRCLWYLCSVSYGGFILSSKPWFWDVNLCFKDYPLHEVDDDVWWYYMMSMGFYVLSIFIIQFEVKRKDFYLMLPHHIVTVTLLYLAWIVNLIRIGSLTILLLECLKPSLEITRMARYTNCLKLGRCTFIVFSITWMTTRLCIFPIFIILRTAFYGMYETLMFPAFNMILSFLSILCLLHFFWSFFVLKALCQFICTGEIKSEVRNNIRVISNLSEISTQL